MRKILLILLVLCTAASVQAQLMQLTTEQMLKGNNKGLLKDLPKIIEWKDDTHFVMAKPKDEGGDTVLVDAKTGKEEKYVFVKSQQSAVSLKENDIYFMQSDGIEKRLTNSKEEEKNPTLSPDKNKIAFTRNNDLYVVDVTSGKETRLTNDATDLVYNGYASWLYYEEILGRSSKYKAFWWSPDSRHIAFMRFDDTHVPLYPIIGADGQHGYMENTRYPEVGDPNPEVKTGIIDIETMQTVWAAFNEKDDQYFGAPFWNPDGTALWLQWMNREQNRLIVYAINPADGSKKSVYDEQQNTWVDWLDDIKFLKDNKGFIIQSDKSGWVHIYQYDMNGNLVKQITNGDWTVKDILNIDETNKKIFFIARKENSARYDLYSIKMDGSAMQRLSFGDFTHTINLSKNASYFITTYSNTSMPQRMALCNNKGAVIKELGNAKGADLDKYEIAPTELVRVKTPDGFDLPVLITWPLHIDNTKKYPVLISIYGGPNAGSVYDGWKGLGQAQWWAKEGLVQVAIDHRGSGHFGKQGQNFMYKDLGTWEINDYSEVVKWLTQKAFIDKNKICITGFSYGGYTTCMALTKGADYFTHGIAGGNVVDWQLYDSHYTEKFMGRPTDNAAGYKSSSVLSYIDQYKGNLYIVHGTMDDNVHMQNSIQLISALQDAKKDFEFMLYPGGRHGWGNLKNKWAHFNNEKAKYYYKYLLEKPLPKEILQ